MQLKMDLLKEQYINHKKKSMEYSLQFNNGNFDNTNKIFETIENDYNMNSLLSSPNPPILLIKDLKDGDNNGSIKLEIISEPIRRVGISAMCQDQENQIIELGIYNIDQRMPPFDSENCFAPGRSFVVQNPFKKKFLSSNEGIRVDDPYSLIISDWNKRCFHLGCSKLGTKICSRCHLISYCCKEHQKSNWILHKKFCREVKIFVDVLPAINYMIYHPYQSPGQPEEIYDYPCMLYLNDDIIEKKTDFCKGMGVFAKRDIAQGTTLLIETPLFCSTSHEKVQKQENDKNDIEKVSLILDIGYKRSIYNTHVLKALSLSANVNEESGIQLTASSEKGKKNARNFLNLLQVLNRSLFSSENKQLVFFCGHNFYTLSRLLNILNTNPFMVDYVFDSKYINKMGRSGLFYHGSRFNHSCCNNAEFRSINHHMLFFATRDIKKGEEIFISYFFSDGDMKRHDFECHCPLCSNIIPVPQTLSHFGGTAASLLSTRYSLINQKLDLFRKLKKNYSQKLVCTIIKICQDIINLIKWINGSSSYYIIEELVFIAEIKGMDDNYYILDNTLFQYLGEPILYIQTHHMPFDLVQFYKYVQKVEKSSYLINCLEQFLKIS